MNKVLYIGQHTAGTTSKMRSDTLEQILLPKTFQVIDIHVPFFSVNRFFRSIGFRFKKGPLIAKVNKYILDNLSHEYDLIWVDKAIFITEKTTKILRSKTKLLIHFSPDPAFTYHKSKHFNNSLKYYDFVITTKSFEKKFYDEFVSEEKIIVTTQGYNKTIHKPYHQFEEKKNGIVFIGHYESYRARILQALIDQGILVEVAGIKWKSFATKNKGNENFTYLGNSINGKDYASTISSYMYSIGFLSKWIPELHTTRTFEIPACGTALLTERNEEIEKFFTDEDVIFYTSNEELIEKIKFFQKHQEELEHITRSGYKKVLEAGYDYHSILSGLLKQMDLI